MLLFHKVCFLSCLFWCHIVTEQTRTIANNDQLYRVGRTRREEKSGNLKLPRRKSQRRRRKQKTRMTTNQGALHAVLQQKGSSGQPMTLESFSSSSSGRVRMKKNQTISFSWSQALMRLTWCQPKRPMWRFLKSWSNSTRKGSTGV